MVSNARQSYPFGLVLRVTTHPQPNTPPNAPPAQIRQMTSSRRKKNAPFLYDVVITHALDWPSLTVQWFPDRES